MLSVFYVFMAFCYFISQNDNNKPHLFYKYYIRFLSFLLSFFPAKKSKKNYPLKQPFQLPIILPSPIHKNFKRPFS